MLATFTASSGNDTIDVFAWAGGGMAVRTNGVISTSTDTSITVHAGLAFKVSSSRSGTTVLARGDGGDDELTNPSVQDLDAAFVAKPAMKSRFSVGRHASALHARRRRRPQRRHRHRRLRAPRRNLNGTNRVWTTGDSNYDNTTGIADFASQAANFNQSLPAGLPRPVGAPTATAAATASSSVSAISRPTCWAPYP
jgi:hypothetical protein